MNTTCEQCESMPVDPVCDDQGNQICNECVAQYCLFLDPSQYSSGDCGAQVAIICNIKCVDT